MGRPRKYSSDAEKQKAYRERQNGEQEPEEEVVQTEVLEAMQERCREAEALGRRHGTAEADSRGETDDKRLGRIERAVAYQVWLADGKPSEIDGALPRGGPDPK